MVKFLNITVGRRIIGVLVGVCLALGATSAYAQSTNAQNLSPVISLLLGEDACLSVISVGDVKFDTLDPKCPSEGQPEGRYAGYFSFTHRGGPLHIDLTSDFPGVYDTYLFLRQGEGRDGELVIGDDDGIDDNSHEDFRSSRIRESDLVPGRYTVEATSFSDAIEGAFNLSVYGNKVTAKATGKLNDTGIAFAGDSNSTNSATCNGTGNFLRQDCSLGRDSAAFIGREEIENDADGHDGFSFQRVANTGAPFVSESYDYEITPWSCVKDNVTGLMWEVKTDDDGLHDKDHTYSWYNTDPSSNGGSDGTQNGGICFAGVDCDTQGYVAAINSQGLCGFNDWRMPQATELFSLANLQATGVPTPIIDTNFFPNASTSIFWSASPDANFTLNAWNIVFNINVVVDRPLVSNESRNDDVSVRLVRGVQ